MEQNSSYEANSCSPSHEICIAKDDYHTAHHPLLVAAAFNIRRLCTERRSCLARGSVLRRDLVPIATPVHASFRRAYVMTQMDAPSTVTARCLSYEMIAFMCIRCQTQILFPF
jgi:hypothetical protein